MDPTTESVRAEDGVVNGILGSLQQRIGPQRFKAWFRSGTTVTLDDGHLKVAVPNPFVANWIEGHYVSEIASAAEDVTGQMMPISVTVDPVLNGQLRKRQLDAQADIVTKAKTGRARPRKPLSPAPVRYRLDDFVVGQSNKLAYSAALAMGNGHNVPFGAMFVYGPCGVGKTHLLQGVCRQVSKVIREGRPMRWRYVTAEQFTNEFLAALRKRNVEQFRQRYRNLDLLAIDDVHFLAAKKATQDEFLHTYNAIEAAGARVVLASDAHPKLVGEFNEQLVSRFLSGIVVKIDMPDEEMRMEILRRRAKAMRIRCSEEVLLYVARHIRTSVRELEGTIVKMAALSALHDGEITLEMAKETLAEYLARTDSAVTLGDIEAVVAAYFGVTPADIHSSRRTRTVSTARMVAMFLARRYTQMSFPEIGKFMGKNHSSVVLGVQRLQKILDEDGDVRWNASQGARSMSAKTVLKLLEEQIH